MKLATLALASAFVYFHAHDVRTCTGTSIHNSSSSSLLRKSSPSSLRKSSTVPPVKCQALPRYGFGMGNYGGNYGGNPNRGGLVGGSTSVPTSPEGKRRVSAGAFCALFDRSSAARLSGLAGMNAAATFATCRSVCECPPIRIVSKVFAACDFKFLEP